MYVYKEKCLHALFYSHIFRYYIILLHIYIYINSIIPYLFHLLFIITIILCEVVFDNYNPFFFYFIHNIIKLLNNISKIMKRTIDIIYVYCILYIQTPQIL